MLLSFQNIETTLVVKNSMTTRLLYKLTMFAQCFF